MRIPERNTTMRTTAIAASRRVEYSISAAMLALALTHVKLWNELAPNQVRYQILHTFSRTIASPFLQPKALANASMFEIGPFPRKRASGCGSVFVCNRAA